MTRRALFGGLGYCFAVILIAAPWSYAEEATDQWVVDININVAAATQNGRYFLAFGKTVGTAEDGPTTMALFDLKNREVLRAVNAPMPKQFGIDQDRIFLVPAKGKRLIVMDLKTFRVKKSITLEESILDLSLLDKSYVGLLLQKESLNSVTYFDRKSLRRAKELEVHEQYAGLLEDYPVSDSLYRTRTELKDRKTSKHSCIVEQPLLPTFSTRKSPYQVPRPQQHEQRLRKLSNLHARNGVISGQADQLRWVSGSQFRGSREQWTWVLESGWKFFRVERKSPFLPEQVESWQVPRLEEKNLNSRYQCMVFREKEVVFISNQVLTFIPRAPISDSDAFRIERQAVPVYTTEKRIEVALAVRGGIGKKLWSLPQVRQNVSIDESTGILSIDLPKIWAEHVAVASDPESGFTTLNRSQAAAEFKRIFGWEVPDDKSPFVIPVQYRVEDAQLRRAERTVYVPVLAPTSDYKIASAISPIVRAADNAMKDAFKEASKSSKPTEQLSPLDRRIEATQRKAREIEQQLGRIVKLVEKIKSLEKDNK